MDLSSNISRLLEEINSKDIKTQRKMLIGIDGFVDHIVHVVNTRENFSSFTRVGTINEFGNRITRASGLSTNIELVPVATKLGGNGPIFAQALLNYGNKITYVGALGKDAISPVFQSMANECDAVYSICDPGFSDAVEFYDGKLIFGKHASLKEIDWEAIKSAMGGTSNIAKIIDECCLVGLENWTMMPYMSQIWEGIIEEVFPLLTPKNKKPFIFFDLADPEKRTRQDILHALSLIGKFQDKFNVILGLNEKEMFEVMGVYDLTITESERYKFLEYAAKAVYEKLSIYCLVVHPIKEAVAVVNSEFFITKGPYCEKPKLTTGAGDNFNAGFSFGQALGLSPLSSLTLGVCTSGYYVKNAKSPTISELIEALPLF